MMKWYFDWLGSNPHYCVAVTLLVFCGTVWTLVLFVILIDRLRERYGRQEKRW